MSNIKNLSYWFWKSFFNINEVKKINNFIEKNFEDFEDIKNGATDSQGSYKKKSIVKLITLNKLKKIQKINDLISSAHNANNKNFGYILYNPNNSDTFLHNTYSSKDLSKYDYHIDVSESMCFDVKFTLLINLSTEKYEGGDFYIFENDEYKVNELSNPGDVIMFKSYLNHRVSPVTKGTRKSLTYFINGPKFR